MEIVTRLSFKQLLKAELYLVAASIYIRHVFVFTNRVLFYVLKQARVHLLDTEPFEDAFGPKTKRKRPKLLAADYESWAKKADGSQGI